MYVSVAIWKEILRAILILFREDMGREFFLKNTDSYYRDCNENIWSSDINLSPLSAWVKKKSECLHISNPD